MIIRALTLFVLEPILLVAAFVIGLMTGGLVVSVFLFCIFNLPVLVVKWVLKNRRPAARRESHAEILAKFHARRNA